MVRTAVSLHSNFLHHTSLCVAQSRGGDGYFGGLAKGELELRSYLVCSEWAIFMCFAVNFHYNSVSVGQPDAAMSFRNSRG